MFSYCYMGHCLVNFGSFGNLKSVFLIGLLVSLNLNKTKNMKKIIGLLALAFFGSCSAPKYYSNFNRPAHRLDGQSVVAKAEEPTPPPVASTMQIEASLNAAPTIFTEKEATQKNYQQLSKTEKVQVRKMLKREIKNVVKIQKREQTANSAKASGIDHDLKLAAIFGAVGVVALILGSAGQAFTILGGIALLIGVIFFVKWIIRQ